MGMYILDDTGVTGTPTFQVGTGAVRPLSVLFDLALMCGADASDLTQDATALILTNNLFQLTFDQTTTLGEACPDRLATLAPLVAAQFPDIVIVGVDYGFVFSGGQSITAMAGATLAAGNSENPTNSILIVYDTTQKNGAGYCAKGQVSGAYDLNEPGAVILYHELSHAFRMGTAGSLSSVSAGCSSSAEEVAAETDENDFRTQLNLPHRDVTDHCGQTCGQTSPPCCFVVATISTGSEYSREVNSLRQIRDSFLRRSNVGFSFFDYLLYDYYSFSPQVCRVMAGSPEIRAQIARGLVRPLTACLGLIKDWALDGCEAEALGCHFETTAAENCLTSAEICRVQAVLQGTLHPFGADTKLSEIAELVDSRARASRYVEWALMQTTTVYLETCRLRLEGATAAELGARLAAAFEDWASRMPLTDVWQTLSRYAVAEELEFLGKALLRTPASRLRLGARLAELLAPDRAMREVLVESGFLSKEAPDEN